MLAHAQQILYESFCFFSCFRNNETNFFFVLVSSAKFGICHNFKKAYNARWEKCYWFLVYEDVKILLHGKFFIVNLEFTVGTRKPIHLMHCTYVFRRAIINVLCAS